MITEDQLEQLAIQWFQDTGWNHVHGAVIAPEGVAAIQSCFRWIKQQHSGKRIGIPKIGAGLGGGDWARIAAIIEGELDAEGVTLVEFAQGMPASYTISTPHFAMRYC